jgi:hypothetical protein
MEFLCVLTEIFFVVLSVLCQEPVMLFVAVFCALMGLTYRLVGKEIQERHSQEMMEGD